MTCRRSFPMGSDRAGGQHGAVHRDSGRGAGRAQDVAPVAAVPRRIAGKRRWTRPAKIYYKWEGVSPAGQPQAQHRRGAGVLRQAGGLEGFATETGAGQWGSALSFAAQLFGLKCKVFMVAISYQQKPYRRVMMETWGGDVVPSPSSETNAGRAILAAGPRITRQPGHRHQRGPGVRGDPRWLQVLAGQRGQLRAACTRRSSAWRRMKQMEMAGDYPDIVIGCAGGGSNAAGLIYPFMKDKLTGDKPDLRAIFVESTACPSMTRGIYAYDWGDTAKTGPVAKMHTVGHGFIPAPVHAGGLRYHGMAPSICALLEQGYAEARAYHQIEVFDAAQSFARAEGTIVAPETAHAVKAATTRRWPARNRASRRSFSSTPAATVTSTWRPTTPTIEQELDDYCLEEEKTPGALDDLPKVKDRTVAQRSQANGARL